MLTRQHSMDMDLAVWVQQWASLDCLPENGVLQYCVFWLFKVHNIVNLSSLRYRGQRLQTDSSHKKSHQLLLERAGRLVV